MGVSSTTVGALRSEGHDAVHLRDEGLIRLPDSAILVKSPFGEPNDPYVRSGFRRPAGGITRKRPERRSVSPAEPNAGGSHTEAFQSSRNMSGRVGKWRDHNRGRRRLQDPPACDPPRIVGEPRLARTRDPEPGIASCTITAGPTRLIRTNFRPPAAPLPGPNATLLA